MSTRGTVLVLNGPNLNLLGTREPAIYGSDTLDDARTLAEKTGAECGVTVDFRQSNHEGVLIDAVQEAAVLARTAPVAIVINPGGLTHTSVSLMDALLGAGLPVVEVHVSNPHRREEFRHLSYVSKVASAVIAGCGIRGYAYAVQQAATLLPAPQG